MTESLQQYLKYYYLEEQYLFKEVTANFQTRKSLTAEEFLAIVIWKSNRSKTKVVGGISRSGTTVEELTGRVFVAEDGATKIELLTAIYGIGIPIASAVLTVCYPELFTVVDYRACAALAKLLATEEPALRRKLRGDPANNPDAYLAYVEVCKAEAGKRNLSLRTLDRILWGIDFFEGENGLKELAASLKPAISSD